jgi:hypothetical protein
VTVPTSFIHWQVVPAVDFPGGIPQVEHAVVEEKAWLAVTSSLSLLTIYNITNGKTVAPDTTAQLNASLGSPNALYNASQAITVHGNEARNENL